MANWRKIEDFPDYEVSDLGEVRSFKKGVLHTMRPGSNCWGYPFVFLSMPGKPRKNITVHRLVCAAFNGPRPAPGYEVAHLDGSRTNNRPDNLAWVTHKTNLHHRVEHGTVLTGESHPRSKMTDQSAREIHAALSNGVPAKQLAERYGISIACIYDLSKGKRWRHLNLPVLKLRERRLAGVIVGKSHN